MLIGIDDSEVNNKIELPKSIGNSVTLPKDLNSIEEINEILIMLADQVSFRLRKYDLLANTVNVQLRTKNFNDYSKQKKFDYPTSNTKDIIKLSKQILKEMYNNEAIRLVGVRVDNLENKEVQQLSLFDMKNEKQDKLDKAIDILKEKYGFNKIKRASDLFIDKSGKE